MENAESYWLAAAFDEGLLDDESLDFVAAGLACALESDFPLDADLSPEVLSDEDVFSPDAALPSDFFSPALSLAVLDPLRLSVR